MIGRRVKATMLSTPMMLMVIQITREAFLESFMVLR